MPPAPDGNGQNDDLTEDDFDDDFEDFEEFDDELTEDEMEEVEKLFKAELTKRNDGLTADRLVGTGIPRTYPSFLIAADSIGAAGEETLIYRDPTGVPVRSGKASAAAGNSRKFLRFKSIALRNVPNETS
jgi:hypothetical protein